MNNRWFIPLLVSLLLVTAIGAWLAFSGFILFSLPPDQPSAHSLPTSSTSASSDHPSSRSNASSEETASHTTSPLESAKSESSAPAAPAASSPSSSVESSSGSSASSDKPSLPAVSSADEAVGFALSSTVTDPGEYLVLTFSGDPMGNPISIQNPFGEAPTFFEIDQRLAALIPINYNHAPGQYTISASCQEIYQEFTVTLQNKAFPTQSLTVDESITSETIDNNNANDEYYQKVQPLKFNAANSALWEGAFLVPIQADYRLTTEFGMLRDRKSVV